MSSYVCDSNNDFIQAPYDQISLRQGIGMKDALKECEAQAKQQGNRDFFVQQHHLPRSPDGSPANNQSLGYTICATMKDPVTKNTPVQNHNHYYGSVCYYRQKP